ncbi:MAG TPA: MerR family DNA-binding transcriptional regulator [Candidatus Binatia bacterium]|jgi:DNA-binding transcriptional MerR regulator
MLISELAEKVDLHPETIRRLERRGLIRSTRDLNNWRRYSQDVVEQLRKLYGQDPGRPVKSAENR